MKRDLLPIILACLTLSLLAYSWSESRPVSIHIDQSADQISFETRQKNLAMALNEQGIILSEGDRVIPALNTMLSPGSSITIQIQRAVSVSLITEGTEHLFKTLASSVGEFLNEQAISLGEMDSVSFDPATTIVPGMSIRVTRRPEVTRVRTVEIPELVSLEDGQEVKAKLVSENTVTPAFDQVLAYGTIGVVSRAGTDYRYARQLDLTATGYTAGKESNPDGNGYTYTGMKAVPGIAAVDPRVIPLYTRLYIEGYGPALAADIGGAIKGNRIDLVFATVEEALQWGVRPVRVYILTD